jgi:hypothetical protein
MMGVALIFTPGFTEIVVPVGAVALVFAMIGAFLVVPYVAAWSALPCSLCPRGGFLHRGKSKP